MSEQKICAECGKEIQGGREVDHGYRTPQGEVEVWVCPACDEELYDEAMSQLP